MEKYVWVNKASDNLEPDDRRKIQAVANEFQMPFWLANFLWQKSSNWPERNITNFKKFLNPSLQDLPDPFSLQDMRKAADRIVLSIENKEKICIYGDYDVDGTVGAALLRRFFRELGITVNVYQPDRKLEGYGLNKKAIEKLAAFGFTLLITVDCGISNMEEVKLAQSLGMDVIIVDHHEVPNPMPAAYAILDHKRMDETSPIQSLCGTGMAFYLALAIRAQLRNSNYFNNGVEAPDLKKYLDLVAVATIADMVPLIQENRILAKIGLEKFKKSPCLGLQALCDVAGIKCSEIKPYHVGFVIGPRINASGRLGSANLAMELLSTENPDEAQELAQQLHTMNKERMDIQQKIVEEAKAQAEKILQEYGEDFPALVLGDKHWHEGVIGIVAARIVEEFHRPVIVCSFESSPEKGKGSVRSYQNIDIHKCLQKCSELLLGFGGHKAAAGISIAVENFEQFRVLFAQVVGEEVAQITKTNQKLLAKNLSIDISLTPELLDLNSTKVLERLAPFGVGNPEPVFCIENANVQQTKVLKDTHLKIWLSRDGQIPIEAIYFQASNIDGISGLSKMHIAGMPQVNSFRGTERLEFRVRDIHPVH